MTTEPKPHVLTTIKADGPDCYTNPWHITYRDKPYTIAGDGFRALLVKGHLPEGHPADAKVADIWIKSIRYNFQKDAEHFCVTTLKRLLAFCDASRVAPDYGNCGRCDRIIYCPDCSDGQHIPKIAYQGMPFNLAWLIQVLSGLEGEEVSVALLGNAIRIRTDAWTYLQMGMYLLSETVAGLPKLEEFLEAQS